MAESMGMGRASFQRAVAYGNVAASRLAKAESFGAYAMRTAITGGSTLGFSMLNGMLGVKGSHLGPLPIDVLFGFGFKGLAAAAQLTDWGRETFVASPNAYMQAVPGLAHSIGDGAFASYLAKVGMGLGIRIRQSMHSATAGDVLVGADSARVLTEGEGCGSDYAYGTGALTPSEAEIYAR